eukprot:3777315-Rhodomonas_salina.3
MLCGEAAATVQYRMRQGQGSSRRLQLAKTSSATLTWCLKGKPFEADRELITAPTTRRLSPIHIHEWSTSPSLSGLFSRALLSTASSDLYVFTAIDIHTTSHPGLCKSGESHGVSRAGTRKREGRTIRKGQARSLSKCRRLPLCRT